jgi:hypothetical protein
MTPKEKAEELINKYFNFIYLDLDYEQSKQCALIVVDEILGDIDDSILHPQNKEAIEYWQKVKKEIEKL